MSAQAYYELYRGSSLGLSLTDTLDDLINEGRIEPQLAMKILSTFDRVITEVLADKVRARLTFKGHLDTYRFCDEVWTFLIKDVTFKLDNQATVTADKVKIKLSDVAFRFSKDFERIQFNMPRTLPWLIGGAKAEDAKSSTRRREVKHQKGSDHRAEETSKASKSTSRGEKRDFLRSSPSPPTSPIQRCPSEEYLIEGFDNDDIYMMVEDEFYAMAQTFTKHLHYAEYVKRKKEAKLQNAAAIKDLARPTDGVTPRSEETKRKEAAATLSARQRAGMEKMGGTRPQLDSDKEEDDTNEDDGLAGTSLQYLMTSPRKARSLVGVWVEKAEDES
ncbi:hypothetical protein LV164_001798 [Aspergillus fumigatus]|nr:hypothetical protein LV157_001297 [Aspergillus fumigatus]KAJ8214246.1 hypothetical protein LV164_001798 [Aspergillus fumigatus]